MTRSLSRFFAPILLASGAALTSGCGAAGSDASTAQSSSEAQGLKAAPGGKAHKRDTPNGTLAETSFRVVPEENENFCSRDDWCWVAPLPQGNTLRTATVIDGAIYAAGDAGILLRYDGQGFVRLRTETNGTIERIWGTADDLLLAVSEELEPRHKRGVALYRRRGPRWDLLREPKHNNIQFAGTLADGIWMSTPHRVRLDFQGKTRSFPVDRATGLLPVDHIWAAASDSVWFTAGDLYHFGGQRVRKVAATGPLKDMWANETELWGIDPAAGRLVHCEREKKCVDLGVQGLELFTRTQSGVLWGVSAKETVKIQEGKVETFPSPGREVLDLVHSERLGLFVVGRAGLIARFNGASWEELSQHRDKTGWSDIWGAAPNNIFWVRHGSAYQFDGKSLSARKLVTQHGGLHAVHGTGPRDVWFGGNRRVAHFNGDQIREEELKELRSYHVMDLVALGSGDLWLAAEQTVPRIHAFLEEDAWTAPPRDVHIYRPTLGVGRLPDGRLVSIGSGPHKGEVGHVRVRTLDNAWEIFARDPFPPSPKSWMEELWVSPEGAVWVASRRNGVARYKDGEWTIFPIPNVPSWRKIFGTSEDEVWFLGNRDAYRFNGRTVVPVDWGTSPGIHSIWGASSSDVWALHPGALLRRERN